MKAGDKVKVTEKPFTLDPEVGSVGTIVVFDGEDYIVEFENWRRGWGIGGARWCCSPSMIKVID